MASLWRRLVHWLGENVTLPEDSESIRIRKTTIATVSLAVVPISLGWSVSFFQIGLQQMGFLNATYSLVVALAVLFLIRTEEILDLH
jgi:hypothetical protein